MTLTVNGKPVDLPDVAEGTPLIHILHKNLGLTGTKLGCGIQKCFACLVAVQDNAESPYERGLGCESAQDYDRKYITTVEGLANGTKLHPLQQAFIDAYAFQCGYSTPGFLMEGFILIDKLRRNPVPVEALDGIILDALENHICRCSGYVRYFEAIKSVMSQTPGLFR